MWVRMRFKDSVRVGVRVCFSYPAVQRLLQRLGIGLELGLEVELSVTS